MEKPEPSLEDLDDYVAAAKFLMTIALSTGNGKMLKAIKTLMDRVELAVSKV